MNEIITKSGYSDIVVSYKFDKDGDIIKMTKVFVKILEEFGYSQNDIEELFSEDTLNKLEKE